MQDLLGQARPKLQKCIDHLMEELKSVRTGRASTALVEDLKVEVYGQQMPLKQLASISTPDATTITISPWDVSNTEAVEKAIREDQGLGLNPLSDGKVIHINIPAPTAERREQLAKQVGEKLEQTNIAMRNIRHDILNEAKKLSKDKQISQDEQHNLEKQLDTKLDECKAKAEELAENKKSEIRAI